MVWRIKRNIWVYIKSVATIKILRNVCLSISFLPVLLCLEMTSYPDIGGKFLYACFALFFLNTVYLLARTRRGYFTLLFVAGWFGWIFLFLLVEFRGVPLSIFTVVAQTTFQEAIAFLSLHQAWGLLFAIVLFGVMGVVVIWKTTEKTKLYSWYQRGYSICFIFVMLAIMIWNDFPDDRSAPPSPASAEISSQIYPLFFLNGFLSLATQMAYGADHATVAWNSKRPLDKEMETYVLVITDASLSTAWQLNGYKRATSPRLAQLDKTEYLNFPHAYAGANLTAVAVPLILTGTAAENYKQIHTRPNLFDLFREQGFITWWLANQEAEIIAKLRIKPDFSSMPLVLNGRPPDGKLIPSFEQALDTRYQKKMIVMHWMGSHSAYKDRFPESWPQFDHQRDSICEIPASLKNYRNCHQRDLYDSTTHYSDWVLAEIIQKLRPLKGKVALLFVSDHGEAFGAEGVIGHGSVYGSIEEQRIPLFVWANAEFRSTYAEKWQALMTNTDKWVGNDSVLPTFADLLGFTSIHLSIERSFARPEYRLREDARVIAGNTHLVPIRGLPKPE